MNKLTEIITQNEHAICNGSNTDDGMELHIDMFTDNFLVYVPWTGDSNLERKSLNDIITFAGRVQYLALAEAGILLRGGISCGDLNVNGFYFGNAYKRAYMLESNLARWPRILIDSRIITNDEDLPKGLCRCDDDCLMVDSIEVFSELTSVQNSLEEFRRSLLDYIKRYVNRVLSDANIDGILTGNFKLEEAISFLRAGRSMGDLITYYNGCVKRMDADPELRIERNVDEDELTLAYNKVIDLIGNHKRSQSSDHIFDAVGELLVKFEQWP